MKKMYILIKFELDFLENEDFNKIILFFFFDSFLHIESSFRDHKLRDTTYNISETYIYETHDVFLL